MIVSNQLTHHSIILLMMMMIEWNPWLNECPTTHFIHQHHWSTKPGVAVRTHGGVSFPHWCKPNYLFFSRQGKSVVMVVHRTVPSTCEVNLDWLSVQSVGLIGPTVWTESQSRVNCLGSGQWPGEWIHLILQWPHQKHPKSQLFLDIRSVLH